MLFHTWTFLIFFIVAFLGTVALRNTRFWLPWLLVISYGFYACWNPYFIFLLLLSTLIDYVIGGKLATIPIRIECPTNSKTRKRYLIASITNNLLVLFFFKYADFFLENINDTAQFLGISTAFSNPILINPNWISYLPPLGISFYTLQSLSYTIDIYYGKIEREKNFFRFATFVSFFPQLVAGPIERAKNLLPQFHQTPKITFNNISSGASLFIYGLFKKLAIADYLAIYVDRIYNDPSQHNAPALILATLAFSWQIYCDFSGYTDMARGVGRVFGFQLSINFKHPYLATSLKEFWSRWHISLSTWFRDYVYIPLGGSKKNKILTLRNLTLTFLISGLWHGAAWNFILWGATHAVGLIANQKCESLSWYQKKIPKLTKTLIIFSFTTFAWVFFRADTVEDAFLIIQRIFTTPWTDPEFPLLMLALILTHWIYQWISESPYKNLVSTNGFKIIINTSILLYLTFFSSKGSPFIYFQF